MSRNKEKEILLSCPRKSVKPVLIRRRNFLKLNKCNISETKHDFLILVGEWNDILIWIYVIKLLVLL